MILRSMFSRKWILTTFLVVLGAAVCARLGIWQLDRLAQRRAFNAHVLSVQAMPPLDLNANPDADVAAMEYRQVVVRGTFDYSNQVALRNQYNSDNVLGYHLVVPLRFADGKAVIVDRGWIPADGNDAPASWSRYEAAGEAEIRGELRLGISTTPFGGRPDPTLAPGQTRLDFWNFVNLDRLALQIPYPILPAYIEPNPDPANANPPIPFQPTLDLSEGPHQGYAIQWFTFAAILLFGYPFYLRKQTKESNQP